MLKVLAILWAALPAPAAPTQILAAGWDGSSRVLGKLATAFVAAEAVAGRQVKVYRSHGGSSRQARAVVDGLPADLLAVSEEADLDSVAAKGRVSKGWRQDLPDSAVPFGSAVVIVVRPGDPKAVGGWKGLTQTALKLVMPNPFTSGSGRVDHLAAVAWGRAEAGFKDNHAQEAYFRALYANVLSFDSGSRGATLTFFERGLGDVLLCWESEAYLAIRRWPGTGQVIWPSVTLAAEPRVALVQRPDQSAEQIAAAVAFARYLFTPPARAIAAAEGFQDLRHWKAPAGTRLVWARDLGKPEDLAREHFGRGGLLETVIERKR